MSWFLDLLDPDNKVTLAKGVEVVAKAPGEALTTAPVKWSTDTKIVVGTVVVGTVAALLLSQSRKSYAKGAASRGGADVKRSGLELVFFGQRKADEDAKAARAKEVRDRAVKLAEARVEAARGL